MILARDGKLSELAAGYLAGGLSLVPTSAKTKRPENRLLPRDGAGKPTWACYQQQPADEATVKGWFTRGCESVAAIGGRVSGGLLIIDFDDARFYPAWREQVGSLAEGLPVQRTGREGGGYQVWLRCPEPGHNDKLAYIPDENEESGRRVAIETRGEGGYAVAPGSLHPSGRRYEAVAGDFANIPTIPQVQADALLAAARKLDEAPHTRQEMERREAAAKACPAYRGESNGQGSVIDAYNERTAIEEALESHGYIRAGQRWKRPGGSSPSVTVTEGRSFHHSSNDALSDNYWHRPFDLFCQLEHGGDCKAAVRAAAGLLGMTTGGTRQTQAGGPNGQQAAARPRVEFRRISCAELDRGAYDLEYLIDSALVARQPCILAGGKKTLKTSLLIDLGISLAMGGCFLGRLRANRACRVGIMTGESGLATIQETARRIAAAAGYKLADIGGLVFSEDLPQFGDMAHEDALRRFIMDDELEVLAVDPAYMCLPDIDHASLFQVGERLRGVSRVCQETGAMLLLAHHTRKTKVDPFSPPELEDIAWAGFQEFCRQWLLIGRREGYQPGTGEHRLWLSAGGSAGHSALWAVDVAEGTRESIGGRYWQVTVLRADEARQQVEDRKVAGKATERQGRLDRDKQTVANALAKFPKGESKSVIRDTSGLYTARFNAAFSELLAEGVAVPCDLIKGRRKTPIEGYKLKDETPHA